MIPYPQCVIGESLQDSYQHPFAFYFEHIYIFVCQKHRQGPFYYKKKNQNQPTDPCFAENYLLNFYTKIIAPSHILDLRGNQHRSCYLEHIYDYMHKEQTAYFYNSCPAIK